MQTSTTRTASPASWRSRRAAEPMPGDPTHCLGVDGHLRLHRPAACSSCCARTRPAPDSDHDFGKDIIPRDDRRRTRSSPTASATRTARPMPYWRDVGTLDAYYQANMDLIDGRPGAEPVRPRLADPHVPAAAAAAEVRLQRRGPPGNARRGEAHRQHGLPGLHHLRRARAAAASCRPNVRVNSYARGGGLDPVRRRRRRPALPHPPGDHRQGREDPAEHRPSATTWSTTAAAASR